MKGCATCHGVIGGGPRSRYMPMILMGLSSSSQTKRIWNQLVLDGEGIEGDGEETMFGLVVVVVVVEIPCL